MSRALGLWRHAGDPAAAVNLHRLDLVSLALFSLVVRTGSIRRGADLSDPASGIVGVVRLVAIRSAVTQFLPADLARFVAAHVGIRLEMGESDSREAVLPSGRLVPARVAGAGGRRAARSTASRCSCWRAK